MRPRVTLAALATALLFAAPASADDDDPALAQAKKKEPDAPASNVEAYDGPIPCNALVARNEQEAKAWSASRPPVPYEVPRTEKIADAPWVAFGRAAGQSAGVIVATLVPHLNAVLRGSVPEPGISWPWSIPFGPIVSCSRANKSFDVSIYRAVRFVLEPGLLFSDRAVAFFVRPGLRIMYHPSTWVVGAGAGLGSMLELTGNEPKRASVSPEALIQFGNCCEPGYVTMSLRREVFFEGKTQLWFATVGYTYF